MALHPPRVLVKAGLGIPCHRRYRMYRWPPVERPQHGKACGPADASCICLRLDHPMKSFLPCSLGNFGRRAVASEDSTPPSGLICDCQLTGRSTQARSAAYRAQGSAALRHLHDCLNCLHTSCKSLRVRLKRSNTGLSMWSYLGTLQESQHLAVYLHLLSPSFWEL